MTRLSIAAFAIALTTSTVAAHAESVLLLDIEQVTTPQGAVGFLNFDGAGQFDITSVTGTGTDFIGDDQAGTVPASISWIFTQLPSRAQDSFFGVFNGPATPADDGHLTGEVTDTDGLFRDAPAELVEDVTKTQNRVELEITATPTTVPELSTWAMMIAGFLALFFVSRCKSTATPA
jgi:hypothetical protein